MGIELTDANEIQPTHVCIVSSEGATVAMRFISKDPESIADILTLLSDRGHVHFSDGKSTMLYVPPKEAGMLVRIVSLSDFEKEMRDQRYAMAQMQNQGRRQ